MQATQPNRSDAGFTLMELIVVMSIMTIMMGLSAYALTSYFRAQALIGATNELLTHIRDAQVRSQAEVRAYRVVFDQDADSFEVQSFDPPDPADESPQNPFNWPVSESRKLDARIDLESVSFSVTGACGEDSSDADYIPPNNHLYFCPRGVSSGGSLILRHRALNQDRKIEMNGLTARAQLT